MQPNRVTGKSFPLLGCINTWVINWVQILHASETLNANMEKKEQEDMFIVGASLLDALAALSASTSSVRRE